MPTDDTQQHDRHDPCCAKHATDHALRLIIISNLLLLERLSLMDTSLKAVDDKLTLIDGKIDELGATWKADLAALKSTIVQQEISPEAQKAITTHLDEILGRLEGGISDAKSAGVAMPGPTPPPAATVTQFRMSATTPASPIADSPFSFELAALDAAGAIVPSYLGAAHFTSDVGGNSVPEDYLFVPSDNGVHTFQAAFPAGTHAITVTEAGNPAIIGTLTVVVG